MPKFHLKSWTWVLYPLAVGVFMVIGINFILSGGFANLTTLREKQSQAQADQAEAEALQAKLDSLKEVDLQKAREDLTTLLQAVPSSKAVWFLISELSLTGQTPGMVIKGYKGNIGDVRDASDSGEASPAAQPVETGNLKLKANFEVADIATLAQGLARMYQMLPLVRVTDVDFTVGEIGSSELTVEGAWAEWTKSVADPLSPLPQYKASVAQALSRIEGYENISQEFVNASVSGITF